MRRTALTLGLATVAIGGLLMADDLLLQHLRRERDFIQSEIDRLSKDSTVQISADSEPAEIELLQADDLEYLGYFLLPKRTKADAAQPDKRVRQFAYTEGIASAGPKGLFISGHEHGTYVAEVTIPEPSKGRPPRAEFIQNFTKLDRGDIDQPRIGGLAYDPERDRLYVNFYRHYNVAHRQFPSLCWGPADLSKHAKEGTPLLEVTDSKGKPVDFERVTGGLAMTPLGFTLVNQKGKHDAKSDGPALAVAHIGEHDVTGYRELLRYPRRSKLFPYPQYVDGTGGWNETCSANGLAVVGRTAAFAGCVGLGTGLENFQDYKPKKGVWVNRNVYYGGPGDYPVEGVSTCKGSASKGYHAPPYKTVLFLYDLDEIVEAEAASHPMPYATVDLSTEEFCGATECGFKPGSLVWIPDKQWLLIPQGGRSEPMIHVFKVSRKAAL